MSNGFYNPYSKNIQWAQGFADIANQLIMMKMIQKMYGGGQGATQPQNPQAVATGGQMTPYQVSGVPNTGPVGVGGEPGEYQNPYRFNYGPESTAPGDPGPTPSFSLPTPPPDTRLGGPRRGHAMTQQLVQGVLPEQSPEMQELAALVMAFLQSAAPESSPQRGFGLREY
jgi:hypothetical protein